MLQGAGTASRPQTSDGQAVVGCVLNPQLVTLLRLHGQQLLRHRRGGNAPPGRQALQRRQLQDRSAAAAAGSLQGRFHGRNLHRPAALLPSCPSGPAGISGEVVPPTDKHDLQPSAHSNRQPTAGSMAIEFINDTRQ